MRLNALELRIYERLGYGTSPDSSVFTRLRNYVNSAYSEIMGKKGFESLRRGVVTFTSVSGSPFAALPQAVSEVYSIADRTRNWLLHEIALTDVRNVDPGLLMAGNPYSYAKYNLASAVYRPPTAAGSLYVVSTDAADGAAKSVEIQGMTADGALRTVSVALNGTSGVNVSSTINNWVRVDKFHLAGSTATTAAGKISLQSAIGGGTEYSFIGIGQDQARFSLIHFYPTPSSSDTYTADVLIRLGELNSANDEALLPEDFHWLLESGAVLREYQRRENHTSYAQELARWKEGIRDLTALVNRSAPTSSAYRQRFSQLGPYYPSGT